MNRIDVTSINEWEEYYRSNQPIATYKHSTRCGVSSMAWSRLSRSWTSDMKLLFVDLIRHRDLSDHIARITGIRHESPQLIVSVNGDVVDHVSHMEISGSWVEEVEKKTLHI